MDFTQLPSGLKILSTTPTGSGGVVLSDNFTLLDQTRLDVEDLKAAVTNGGRYEHHQTVPAQTWTVNHALGRYPSNVSVTDDSGNVVITDVQHISTMTTVITFGIVNPITRSTLATGRAVIA